MRLTVYDGRLPLGTVHQDDGGDYVALDLEERTLGRFRTTSEALAAISAQPKPAPPTKPASPSPKGARQWRA